MYLQKEVLGFKILSVRRILRSKALQLEIFGQLDVHTCRVLRQRAHKQDSACPKIQTEGT